VVLVAGGTGALGAAVSRAFVREGAAVVTTYRSPEEFETLRGSADGLAIEGERVDVTDDAAVHRLVATVRSRHSRLDAVVNAVGGYVGGTQLWELDPAGFDRMLALNLRSIYALSRASVPAMLEARRGCLVNVAARAGVEPPAGAAAYAASKAAAVALLESLAAELRGTGVRVNSILPSTIDTPANRRAMPEAAANGKWPTPEDIASVILFLCSQEARVIHGASIPVYGN
jgi:NAD(P)-dependent dehydrogenase (short-subunit alcohol dehydrogenase family)